VADRMRTATAPDVLSRFSVLSREWFLGAFAAPTPAQVGAWDAVSAGQDALVVAPTGSGKTLAAFLWALDRLATTPRPEDPAARCRVLYVSPLKALAVDVHRNLRSPLVGMQQVARRRGEPEPDITVAVRSGDTPVEERRRFARRPSDILITTPESLFLLLTSQARASLTGVQTVIVDEIHAVAGTKRGAHLALSLERLDHLLPRPAQRIGLSATVRPIDRVGAFLTGGRPVQVVAPPSSKQFDLRVEVPVADMADLGAVADEVSGSAAGDQPRSSIWPHVEERVLDLVQQHSSTLVFANSRRLAERLTARLNEAAAEQAGLGGSDPTSRPPAESPAQSGASAPIAQGAPVVARAHHGSVSKEQRALIEDDLKSGRLPAVVATSSLELGIDMGSVDLVVQVEAPPSVASGLQRVGRAGHQVGAVSRGVVFPKFRGDLVASAVTVERMRAGQIEALTVPQNPLDVLAQQIVAAVAMDDWEVDRLLALVRRAYPFATLPQSAFDAVLDMLAGRYPSDEFAELRPRLVWDRTAAVLRARPGAQRLAVTSGGTIPDRGLFGVFLVGERAARVGELDEEMVYESRVGDVFALGATSWRIEDITHDRVLVSPAPGQPGRLPFWHGDSVGRPAELGRALGEFVRVMGSLPPARAAARAGEAGLDELAVGNLLDYLREQRAATGHLPDDRTVVVERFRDELGDWRMVVHSPYGARVHAPWALAVAGRLRERYGVDVQAAHADDGMIFRIPDTVADPWASDGDLGATSTGPPTADLVLVAADEVDDLVTAEVGGSALFASRFRECAARALLLPRRDPQRRTPLWQQRQRSAHLLSVAAQYGTFPILLETMRECLQDVYDLPALVELSRRLSAGEIQVVEVETATPSPFARSLLFGYVAAFMYEGDSPLAERRAQALTLDASLLAELLGRAELRELLDLGVIQATEAELQRLAPGRHARTHEEVADLLRTVGALSLTEITARCTAPEVAADAVERLARQRRVIEVRIAGTPRWAPVEDAARLRDALGCALPVGIPEVFLEPVDDPLGDLLSRYARTHGPFSAAAAAARLGTGPAVVTDALRRLAARGRVTQGEFRPDGSGTEWCDPEVLRRLRRRSVAALRQEAEPVEPAALARFLPDWQHVGSSLRGTAGVLRCVEQLAGFPVPASAWETLVLPARVQGYQPGLLDELTAAGEVLWAGHGRLPGGDGWVSLHLAEDAALTLPTPTEEEWDADSVPGRVLAALAGGGGLFFRTLVDLAQAPDDEVAESLWTLAWSGRVTNDTLAPVRASVGGSRARSGGRAVAVHGGTATARRAARAGRFGRQRAVLPVRQVPLGLSGRWALLPDVETDTTVRAHAAAQLMLDRHGVVTRGAVVSEGVPGGFAAAYRVLSAAEDAGRCRRGYAVAGLGGAQFALPGVVDRLRRFADDTPRDGSDPAALVLAATDPANAYGAALPWPAPSQGSHRPGRKAGAVVVLVGGELVLYVERGGRSVLSFTDDGRRLSAAAAALADAVRRGALGRITVQRADGEAVSTGAVGEALGRAGFQLTPRGLRLRPGAP
jgi:ATP-dependent helicase Lhr and Lhr-like helicase